MSARNERGQAMVLTVVFLVVLLGMAAMVLDVGSWYRADRDTQSTADAAALAGAQALPEDPATAVTLAQQYAAKNGGLGSGTIRSLETRDLLTATGPGVDAFSYHHYGTVSRRCAGGAVPMTTPDDALSEEWLSRTDASLAFYRSLRDEFEPGKPMWLTEE